MTEYNRYRHLLDAQPGELEALEQKAAGDPWKPIYHIHAPFGLINDPNGLAHFNGEYHVFYQWHPFAPVHAMKHWAHVKSKDFVTWERMPVALIPTETFESHGAYSGGGLVKDDQLYLYYTGNIKYEDGGRNANQCLAIMDKDYTITKVASNPIIDGVPEGYTGHVRDPKVWEQDGRYYMVLGAQRENETGTIIIYESDDALAWSLKGELTLDLPQVAYMWECPDYFKLDGKDVFVFSPQGFEKEGHNYQNLYNVLYVVGKFDLETLQFEVEHYEEIDKGFDFYAPQTFEDDFGRRILLAWAGMGEMDYPSDANMWSQCLSIPRELRLENNKLIQKPIKELEKLRDQVYTFTADICNESVTLEGFAETSYEMNIRFDWKDSNECAFTFGKGEEEGLTITFNRQTGVVEVDRSHTEHPFGEDFGFTRTALLEMTDSVDMQVFYDASIVEIFINGGKLVFTNRHFPTKDGVHVGIACDGQLHYDITAYKQKRGIDQE